MPNTTKINTELLAAVEAYIGECHIDELFETAERYNSTTKTFEKKSRLLLQAHLRQ
jgi:hypothetical protein